MSISDVTKKYILEQEIKPIQTIKTYGKEPYIDNNGTLFIPVDADPKYHWWKNGQSIKDTLTELNASDEIKKQYHL